MSLLTIVRGACDRLSLVRPSAVISATDQTTLNLLGFAQQEGKELARRAAWQALTSEKTFSTTAAAAQVGGLPDDFDWYIPDTMFNRTSRRRVAGPLSNEQWQGMQATLITIVNPAFRIRGGSILLSPTPGAGETVGYEYITKNWCRSATLTAQSAWTADTDTAVLDEEMHTLGVIWRFKHSKGLDYAEEFRSYEAMVNLAMTRDGARPRIQTANQSTDRVPTPPQIPETLTIA